MSERIGKYEIISQVGEGSTSSVFLAHDPFAQRDVAIKRIHQSVLRDPERGRLYRHLLLNEASLAGKLIHPHIVQIYDAVVEPEEGYVVMEYVAGGTLERHASPDSLLPHSHLLEIIFKCTRALDHAYRQGVTHRDIKPANILLVATDAKDIKLSDFGSALFSASETTQVSGVGSPAYMSPQQVREVPLNHQTDIYSLGVVMYQLLTGRLPFEASNNYSLLYRITHDEAVPPSQLNPEVPPSLDAIVMRAMQKDLDKRYQSWSDFSHDLAQAFRNHELALQRGIIAEPQKFQSLRGMAFFREFSDVELWEVIRISEWSVVQPATTLMQEGEPGNFFCFICAGEARVSKQGRLLNVLTAGDCFGEMALFSAGGGIRSARVDTSTEVELLTVRAATLNRASDACRMHFYKAFLEVLATRLSLANSRIANE